MGAWLISRRKTMCWELTAHGCARSKTARTAFQASESFSARSSCRCSARRGRMALLTASAAAAAAAAPGAPTAAEFSARGKEYSEEIRARRAASARRVISPASWGGGGGGDAERSKVGKIDVVPPIILPLVIASTSYPVKS